MLNGTLTWFGLVMFSVVLCGCGWPLPERRDVSAPVTQQEIEDIDLQTRLRVAEDPISKKERQVIALQAAPADVEADLLKQRLSAAKVALAASAQSNRSSEAAQPVKVDNPRWTKFVRVDPSLELPPPAPSRRTRLQLVDPKTFDLKR